MPSVIVSALWFAIFAPLVMFATNVPRFARPMFIILFSVLLAGLLGSAITLLAHVFLPPHHLVETPSIGRALLSGAFMGAYFGFVAGLAKFFCGRHG